MSALWAITYAKYVHLISSEAHDKPTPTVHTSPAVKTYSKTAAAPRNGNVVPASTYKSPAAQSKPPHQPGGSTGRVTYTVQKPSSTFVIYSCFPLKCLRFCFCRGMSNYVLLLLLHTEGTPVLLNGCCSAITCIAGFILDTKPFRIMSSIKTRGIPLMSSDYWLFPRWS